MKKWLIGVITVGLLVIGGIGAAWAADSNSGSVNGWSFEKMLPFMKQMHPNMNDSSLKQMYNSCNANGGPAKMGQMMQNGTMSKGMQQMMGNTQTNK